MSIQNSFCLLHRSFETELAEACAPSNYNIGLLPWTPLGGGALTGKYLNGAHPSEGRLVKYSKFMQRYLNPSSVDATGKYAAIAEKAGVSLATLVGGAMGAVHVHAHGISPRMAGVCLAVILTSVCLMMPC